MTGILPWVILFVPLLAALSITLLTLRHRALSAGLSIGAICVSFVGSLLIWISFDGGSVQYSTPWLSVGGLHVDLGLLLDSLSVTMLLVVTGVGALIHIYSYGYMAEDPGMPRYFAGLSFFTFSMLGVVLSNNFVQLFIFWELVGVSSYLLIGFWYDRPTAADAGKKAFLTNRLGDFGFLLGIILVWTTIGSLNFGEIEATMRANPEIFGSLASIAGLLVFCGALGKSAQFPLHVWLPDAMEGPTPVSALIHAATMVAAGIYMLSRVFFLFNETALLVIAWIGGVTALLAAVIAIQQDDIKRILAYSTLSQLGYMVMAVGVMDPTAGMYHLTTHASFKALLFLGAGAVIHAMHHEQNIWKMGGLRRAMPVTYWMFLIATLAICGVPPFSGFFSKESILAAALEHNAILFGVGAGVAALTAFYMFRLVYAVFIGPPKSNAAEYAHEVPGVMKWPQVLLGVPSLLAGFWGIEHFIGQSFASASAHHAAAWHWQILSPFSHAPLAAFFGLGLIGFGIAAAYAFYGNAVRDPLPDEMGRLSTAIRERLYLDEAYTAMIRYSHEVLALIADWIDRWVISGMLVRGSQWGTDLAGRLLRMAQTGNVQTYALFLVVAVVVVLWFVLKR